MPRSKRNKQIELAKTKKRGLEWKKRLFEEVRSCVDKYENVFIFSVNDMRNNKMKTVREQWKHSRFFIGKNKIMAMALGRFAEEEYKPNLHKIGQQIKGQRGLLFSNKPVEEVLSWFRSYSEGDYARSGNTATEAVHLPAGPLTKFPHNLEPYLRELGLPTSLEKGVIHLIKDHEVCKAGDMLTPESAKILKLLGYEMAEFHITINCVWSKDGTFLQLTESFDSDAVENKKQKKKSSLSSKIIEENNTAEDEKMEIEQNEESSGDDDDEEEEEEEIKSNQTENNVIKTDISNIITTTSTPKNKNKDVTENGVSNVNKEIEKGILECSMEEMPEKNNNINDIKETVRKSLDGISEIINILSDKIVDKNDMEEISEENNNKNPFEEISEKVNDNASEKSEQKMSPSKNRGKGVKGVLEYCMEEVSEKNNNLNDKKERARKSSDGISDIENFMFGKIVDKNDIEEISEDDNNNQNPFEGMSEEVNANASEKSEQKMSPSKNRKTRASIKTPRNAKKVNTSKNESLLKTPDANTSQDSPVFRELRNRSVKVIRKKKVINKK